MQTKVLEIRDEGTHIPALAIKMLADNSTQAWYIHGRCGYPKDGSSIMLMMLDDGKATNDPYEWPSLGMGSRTMGNAHNWILEHFDELADGDVVDVQFILGERERPKASERSCSLPILGTLVSDGRPGSGVFTKDSTFGRQS
jgi:hypothetical protein